MAFCICDNKNDKTASILCEECNKWFHRRCLAIPWKEFRALREDADSSWICPACNNSTIPIPTTPSLQTSRNDNDLEHADVSPNKSDNLTSTLSTIKCPSCPRLFKNNTGLSHHVRHHHPEEYRKSILQKVSSILLRMKKPKRQTLNSIKSIRL